MSAKDLQIKLIGERLLKGETVSKEEERLWFAEIDYRKQNGLEVTEKEADHHFTMIMFEIDEMFETTEKLTVPGDVLEQARLRLLGIS